MTAVDYRAFDPALDEAGTQALFRLSFPETAGTPVETPDHRAWKFSRFPDPVPSYEYVAACPGELVGYYAAIPYQYLIDGKVHRCGMVCDVMTHPDKRGMGIFTGIGRFATAAMRTEGLGFTTGYPIRPEVIPGHLKVGWKVVVDLPMYLRPTGLRSFLPKPLRPLARGLDPLLQLAQAWTLRRPRGYVTETLTREQFLQAFEGPGANEYREFIASWARQSANTLDKSTDFLRWRTGAPGTTYQFVLLRRDARLVGMAIARPTVLKGVETLAVLDFMVLASDLAGSRALHLELRRLARQSGKDAVACMISRRWAKAYGFAGSLYVRTPAVFSLIVKKLDDAIPESVLHDGGRWHLTWLDSDDL